MRLLILLCLGGLLASAAANDMEVIFNYDFEPALKDEAKWKVIFNCYMERAPCGEYQAVKDATVRTFINKCEKCTSEQNQKFEDLMTRAIETYPNDFGEMLTKYTPA